MAQPFATTRWSIVIRAGGPDNPEGRRALEDLCRTYWPAVYAYVQRRGHDPDAAKDLTQGFFAEILEKNSVRRANPERGRFRSFLLSSVKNYLANEWDKQTAQKRGGGTATLSLDYDACTAGYLMEPADPGDPAKAFERAWALALLDRALSRLHAEVDASSAKDYFDELKPYLTGDAPDTSVKEAAQQLGLTESALKSRIHRMRRRFGELMREEVEQTVEDSRHVAGEIEFLFKALG